MNDVINTIIKTLSGAIDVLSKKLGVATNKIYPILLKQAKCDFFMDLSWIILFIIIFIVLTKFIISEYKKYSHDEGIFYDSYYRGEAVILIFGILISIGLYVGGIITVIYCVRDCIQIYVNPDWYVFIKYIKPIIGSFH